MRNRTNKPEDIWSKLWCDGDEKSCWIFGGFKEPKMGYGQFSVNGTTRPAHVVAFEVFNGRSVKNGSSVLHSCNNGSCCNPAHLHEGTGFQNQQHAVVSGSHKPGVSGCVGVRYDRTRERWISSARWEGRRVNLYQGRDFFEACCKRKSWDAKTGNPLLWIEEEVK